MKRSIIGIALLAGMMLLSCQKGNTSVASSPVSDTSASTVISDSTVVSDSTSASTSVSTSVETDADYQVTKEEFIAALTTGLRNSTLKVHLASEEMEMDETSEYYFAGDTFFRLGADGSRTYSQLKDGILTKARARIVNNKITYEAGTPEDDSEDNITAIWDTYEGITVSSDSSTSVNVESVLGDIYDTLTYDAATKSYKSASQQVYAFHNKLPTAFSRKETYRISEYSLSVTISDIGTTTVTIPDGALACFGYHTVTYYNADGTTVFATKLAADGGSVPELDSYPQEADKDANTAMIFDKWTIVGEGDMTAIKADIAVKATFKEVAYSSIFTLGGTSVTLNVPTGVNVNNVTPFWYPTPTAEAKSYGTLTIPESWGATVVNLNALVCYPNATIVLPSTVTSITNLNGKDAKRVDVSKDSNLVIQDKLLLDKDKKIVYGYTDPTATAFTLPDTVTTIYSYAFANSAVSKLTLPDSLTTLYSYAFANCQSLTSLSLPDGIEIIDSYCFYNSGLTSFSWPSSITAIPNYCFDYCQALASITLPDTLTSIGAYAFYGTLALTAITLPASLTSFGDGSFYSSGLTSIAIPDKVTKINYCCFAYCSSLTSVTFGTASELTTLGDGAFEYTGITAVTLPSKVTSFGWTFYSCPDLVSADLSACTGLTAIPGWGFAEDTSLTTLLLPSSITSLGDYALRGTKITSLTLSKGVSLGIGVFAGTDINVDYSATDMVVENKVAYNDDTKTEVKLALGKVNSYTAPDSLEGIDSGAFDAAGLTSVDLSAVPLTSDLVINDYALAYNKDLTEITFPSKTAATATGSVYLEDYALAGTGFASLTLPSSVTYVGYECFEDCTDLVHADLSQSSIEYLPNYLFANDTALEDVVLPKGLQYISYNVFNNCPSLKSIYLMDTQMDSNIYWSDGTAGGSWNCTGDENMISTYSIPSYANYYLYSEEQPLMNARQYWHYVDGKPQVWSK